MACLGAAFKSISDDVRDTIALDVARLLHLEVASVMVGGRRDAAHGSVVTQSDKDARAKRRAIADASLKNVRRGESGIGPEFDADVAFWVTGEITLDEFARRTLRRHGLLP